MRGCLDSCYLFWEIHSIKNIKDESVRRKLLTEFEKCENGEDFNYQLLKGIIRRICLGNYRKDDDELREKCPYYMEIYEDLDYHDRIEILDKKKEKKWKRITIIISIVGILVSGIFAYLNFSKPTNEDLKRTNLLLQKKLDECGKKVLEKL